ncbi:MAG: MBL fold metallo-hydrolase [Bacteroidia bacterium]|nr:MBL fold metallo-hydrolase [Bacteroidia bacterium]
MIRTIDLEFQRNACTIAAYAIDSIEAGLVLIETGPYTTFENLKAELAAINYQISDVKHVLLTHIHLDHAGAAWALAKLGARIYVHPVGAPHLIDPSKLLESARRIYQDQMETLWGEIQPIPAEQVQTVEHEEEIKIGKLIFKAWHTPGHAKHHIAWQVDGIVFTGDVAGVQIGKGPVIAPLPPPDIDLEQWEQSIELLRSLKPKALYLTHYGAVTNVADQLDQLKESMYQQANWVKDHMDNGRSAEEMVPLFEQLHEEALTQMGFTEVEIEQYRAANPAGMSVQGLIRYWKSKIKQD